MTAIEEMAGMDVLCSDKTGTLTLNKLTVDKNLIEVISCATCTFEHSSSYFIQMVTGQGKTAKASTRNYANGSTCSFGTYIYIAVI